MRKIILLFCTVILMPCCLQAQWEQLGNSFEGDKPNNYKGYSMSFSADGNTVAVGTPLTTANMSVPTENRSYVQIFRINDGNWEQLGENIWGGVHFLSGRAAPRNGADLKLSADGNTIVVAEPTYYYPNPEDENQTIVSDRTRIFELVNNQWQQVGEDIYGSVRTVAISADGNIVAISSDYDNYNTGIVKVYKNQNDQWIQLGQTFYGSFSGEYFGRSIDISSDGAVLAIASPVGEGGGLTPNPGFANIYDLQDETWVLSKTIIGLPSNDGYGRGGYCSAVSLSGDGKIIAIGASQYRNSNNTYVGNVRVFQNTSGDWLQIGELIEGGRSSHENTKSMVDLSSDGSVLAMGTMTSSSVGNVKVYKNNQNSWEQVGETLSSVTGEGGFGSLATLSADGTVLGIGMFLANINGNATAGKAEVYKNCSLVNLTFTTDADTFCSGSSVTVTATIDQEFYSEGPIRWYSTVDATESIFTGTEFETPELTETTSYWLDSVTPNGCVSARQEIVLTLSPSPELTIPATEVNVCEGNEAVLSAAVESGNLVVWYDSADATQWIATGAEFTTPELTETTSYWVQGYNPSTHCVSERTEIVVTVLPAPILTIEETEVIICSGNEASLYANSPSNVIFWYANEDDTEYLYHGNLFVTEVLTENTTFWVEAYNLATGCRSERIKVTVTVGEALSAPIAASQQEYQTGMTLADLEVEHTAPLTWYADAQLTQELPETTLVVAGTTYYVTQSGVGCESAATAILVDTFLGNGNLNNDKFAYYPNPVKDVLNFKGNEVVKSVQVYDLNGKLILNQNSNSISSINLNSLPKGTYVVRATTEKGINTFKIVKN